MTPAEADVEPGSLRLQGSTGFDQTTPIKGNYSPNKADGTVDMHFDNVPTTANYTLTYIDGDGQPTVIVQSQPYHSLKDGSGGPASTAGP